MDPEFKACHWWTNPSDGRRYLIPGCYGTINGGMKACTCPRLAKRRLTHRHHDPLADYAHVVSMWGLSREKVREQALEIRELKRKVEMLQRELGLIGDIE